MKKTTQQVSTKNVISVISQLWHGKSILRALMNEEMKNIVVTGKILDLGSGKKLPTYYQYIKPRKPFNITLTDKYYSEKSIIKLDLEKPFQLNKSYDNIFCCNVLEHLYNPTAILRSAYDHLASKGRFIGFVPFFIKIHPDPHDYHRYTAESLTKLLQKAGFKKDIEMIIIGVGPWTAAFSQIIEFIWTPLRPLIALPCLGLDAIINKISTYHRGAYPLGYLFIAKK